MATIALYANQINQMSGRIKTVQSAVTDYKEKLLSLQKQAITINKSACELDEVIASIKTSTQTQDDKNEALSTFITESEEFIGESERIDCDVRDVINERKNDFYEEYEYLRPECEKPEKKWYEKVGVVICSGLKKAGEWVKEHWKEIVVTVVIVIGAVLAIAAVVCSGGTALVPMLAALLTTIGMSAGTAATVATIASISIATIAVLSTIGSSALNIIGTWKDMSGNSTFKKWQTALNITCAVSNGIYSLGEIFNLLSTKIGGVAKSGASVVDDVVDGGTYSTFGDMSEVDGIRYKDWNYEKIREMSIHNPESDTLTLGKYRPSKNIDGTDNWKVAGPDSYNVIAEKNGNMYFDMKDGLYDDVMDNYKLSYQDMFDEFNTSALDKAIDEGKTIRFSHNPELAEYAGSFTDQEWKYLQKNGDYLYLREEGGFWYAER